MAATAKQTRLEAGRRMFTRILVGIDGSQQALEAARQAALLQDVDGHLTLLGVWNIAPVMGIAGSKIPYYLDEGFQRTAAEKGLREATEYVAPYTAAITRLVRGTPAATLLAEIERDEDTLISIGGSGTGRLLGIVEGSVATQLIHRSPSSVLVVRQAKDGFPRRILVGVDGSVESAAAYATARYLAERFDAELYPLVAWGGKGVDERLVAAITKGEHEDRRETPAHALTDAAERADLVVVGSRGLHGLRALGSVSERVAHTASCSTLVVREPIWQRVASPRSSPRPRKASDPERRTTP
jgi:nucleotide-binding universal stress UspA family protein